MKQIILGLALMFIINLVFAQEATYSNVQAEKYRNNQLFKSYVSKDGTVYKVGDTLKIGVPSSNKTFAFVYMYSFGGTPERAPISISGTNAIIKKIRVVGNKRAGFQASFQTKGYSSLMNYYIGIEEALATGEIKTSKMSSDEALAELKKEKDKLDLQLITEQQYDSAKAVLVKYIK